MFVGVPRIFEKIKESLEEVEKNSSKLKGKLIQWAKNAALERQKLILEGKLQHGTKESWKYWIAYKLILRQVRCFC